MKAAFASLLASFAVVVTTIAAPQAPPAAAPAATDVYHVMFTKAAPGQAAELAKVLMTPDKTNAMPDHFVVLRHQEGDDWDYVVIQHMGAKAEVVPTPPAARSARSPAHRLAQRHLRERSGMGRVHAADGNRRHRSRGWTGLCDWCPSRGGRTPRAVTDRAERPGQPVEQNSDGQPPAHACRRRRLEFSDNHPLQLLERSGQ